MFCDSDAASKDDIRLLMGRLTAMEKRLGEIQEEIRRNSLKSDEVLNSLTRIKADQKELSHTTSASCLLAALIVMLYIKFTSTRPFVQDFVLFGALLVHFIFGIIVPRSSCHLGDSAEGRETAVVAVFAGYMSESILGTVFNAHGVSFDGTGIVFFTLFIFLGSVQKEAIGLLSIVFVAAKLYYHGKLIPDSIWGYDVRAKIYYLSALVDNSPSSSATAEKSVTDEFTASTLLLIFTVQIIAFSLLALLYRERRVSQEHLHLQQQQLYAGSAEGPTEISRLGGSAARGEGGGGGG